MGKANAFLAAAAAHKIEGEDTESDASPLPRIKFLAENKESSDYGEDGPGSIDRAYNGQRQVFNGKIAKQP